jgi:hypothetical protein
MVCAEGLRVYRSFQELGEPLRERIDLRRFGFRIKTDRSRYEVGGVRHTSTVAQKRWIIDLIQKDLRFHQMNHDWFTLRRLRSRPLVMEKAPTQQLWRLA